VPRQGSFGVKEVDKLMGGAIPFGSNLLMETEPGTEELCFVAAFLNEALREGSISAILLTDFPHETMISKFTELGVDVKGALDSGSFIIVDYVTEGKYDPEHRGPILTTENPNDPSWVLRSYNALADLSVRSLKSGKFTGSRVVNLSTSSRLMRYKFEPTYRAAKIGLNMVRQHKVLALATIYPKMFDQTVVAAFEHLNDGIIELTVEEVEGRYQRFFRVKQSPISGFHKDAVPYDIVDKKPRLVTSFVEG
jgi:KaiC/GvpD/RAD55 family RecA-like ATPase